MPKKTTHRKKPDLSHLNRCEGITAKGGRCKRPCKGVYCGLHTTEHSGELILEFVKVSDRLYLADRIRMRREGKIPYTYDMTDMFHAYINRGYKNESVYYINYTGYGWEIVFLSGVFDMNYQKLIKERWLGSEYEKEALKWVDALKDAGYYKDRWGGDAVMCDLCRMLWARNTVHDHTIMCT